MRTITTYIDQVRVLRSATYDGTNGTEIVNQFGASVLSDTGTVLTYLDNGEEFACPLGQRIFWSDSSAGSGFGTDLIPFPWKVLPDPVTGTGAAYALVTVTGSASVPASLLGGVQTIDVTLAPVAGGLGRTLSGTVFTPLVSLRGAPNIISGHSISNLIPPIPLSATSSRVTVISGAASLTGAIVYVVAQQVRAV